MADRQFQQINYSLEKSLVRLYCAVSVGAAGAVTLQKPPSLSNSGVGSYTAAATGGVPLHSNGWQGVSTITRISTGVYTFTLQDAYQRLLGVKVIAQNATGLPTAFSVGLWNSTNVTSNTAPIIKLTMLSATATAADPASGDTLYFEFILQNSTAV